MNPIEWAIAKVSPERALARARAMTALRAMMNYDAATTTGRASSWRPTASDADGAAQRRARLAYVARDMLRNTPLATRAQSVIVNNVVGTGIIPKIKGGTKSHQAELLDLIERHLDTASIDADGRTNLYGLQRLALNTVVDAGEVLIRRRLRERRDGLPLSLQLQVLEPDFIDTSRDGVIDGNEVREGIEYDGIGRRIAYWLFPRHPGGTFRLGRTWESRRVPASEILHIYRQDRPGQMRGVSWFAPVAMTLQDMADHQDAQLMRQKIAACFVAFRISPDADTDPTADISGLATSLVPGRIQNVAPGEDIRFATPPGVEAYDEFTRTVLRSVAVGMGITYEALSGDLSNVNFSSARIGRMEMAANVESWQWLMLIPQMMQPIGQWIIDQWALERMTRPARGVNIEWVPPPLRLVDPKTEIISLREKVRAGFASRQSVVRELGYDPERLLEEQIEDAAMADAAGLAFDSDARNAAAGQAAKPAENEKDKADEQ